MCIIYNNFDFTYYDFRMSIIVMCVVTVFYVLNVKINAKIFTIGSYVLFS